jgi:uncharacterized membrane protein YhaH (DUF805 family)
MEWMFLPLRRYADFSGRSRRLEYWLFSLFVLFFLVGTALIGGMAGVMTADNGIESSGSGIFPAFSFLAIIIGFFALLIPMIAVTVRRLHDQDKSGWFILVYFVPYVGGLILMVLMFIDGTAGPNRFGPDPKGRGDTLADVFM